MVGLLSLLPLWKEIGEEKIKEISTKFYDAVYADTDPDHKPFVDQFTKTDKALSIHNQISFFVQKFGGPEYYGGMVKESAFILDMHKKHFFIPPSYLVIWIELFEKAVKDIDFGKRNDEVREVLLHWISLFGKLPPLCSCSNIHMNR